MYVLLALDMYYRLLLSLSLLQAVHELLVYVNDDAVGIHEMMMMVMMVTRAMLTWIE